MANKINTSDYELSKEDARAYFDFILWINANPNGGTFKCNGFEITVTTLK